MLIFALADREPAAYNFDGQLPRDCRGMLYHVAYTAEGGATATLDVKIQYYDMVANTYEDYKDSEGNTIAFAQFTGVSEDDLVLFPDMTQTADATHPLATGRRFAAPHPRKFRVVATVGTDNLTFSIAGIPLA